MIASKAKDYSVALFLTKFLQLRLFLEKNVCFQRVDVQLNIKFKAPKQQNQAIVITIATTL